MAVRVSKMKAEGCSPTAALEELAVLESAHKRRLEAERKEGKIEALMAEVRAFGRWPEQHPPSEDPRREAERLLAQRVAKMIAAARLPPAVLEELEAMRVHPGRAEA